ncbi:hypothetical protein EAI_05443, partial [Harpegnathos saltator]
VFSSVESNMATDKVHIRYYICTNSNKKNAIRPYESIYPFPSEDVLSCDMYAFWPKQFKSNDFSL